MLGYKAASVNEKCKRFASFGKVFPSYSKTNRSNRPNHGKKHDVDGSKQMLERQNRKTRGTNGTFCAYSTNVFGNSGARISGMRKPNQDLGGQRRPRERRTWTRLPLLIPLFVRTRNRSGKGFLEFVTTLNISASGALVAIRGSLRQAAQVSLEIPKAPLPSSIRIKGTSRQLRAKIERVTHKDGYNLVALRFMRPLVKLEGSPKERLEKQLSTM